MRGGDQIRLSGVRARGHHGVLDHERRDGQDFAVDVVMELDLRPAGTSDELARTVHYGEVAADVVAVVEGEPRDLIETVAEEIATRVLARPLVEAVEVTVHKPQAPVGVPFGDVAVVVRRRRDVPVVIALGANLAGTDGAEPAETLRAAVGRLRRLRGLRGVRASRSFVTAPVGGEAVAGQPDYVNAVALARTSLSPASLLAALHRVEAAFGRTREVRWAARTLDLDLVQYGDPSAGTDVVSEDPELALPHPRSHERAFVLVPWADLDPAATLRRDGDVVAVGDLVPGLVEQRVLPMEEGP
ncbi:2-amino-4-hydroxy-6-hydroxymethyldihydropteridine pyrophosphokinase [Serinicoccus sp. CUA-874]|uniref:dihydroneopterin aldolase n=1 Tax=Serinicoccus sp. CUA-874 TaxID=1517939 RepID=UPI00095A9AAB|nr:dihydroneopterin aldolase [Serinicoccus sp. CUA-874]OLT18375.1 2-amino-4-hydroxy-6-hydroxymethyldihydropteridine pyrophosphokinase [Serinicoccus sp. CUA-874]